MSFTRYLDLPLELRQDIISHHLISNVSDYDFPQCRTSTIKFVLSPEWVKSQLRALLITSKGTRSDALRLLTAGVLSLSTQGLLYYLCLLDANDSLKKVKDIDLHLRDDLYKQDASAVAKISSILSSHPSIRLHIQWLGAFGHLLPHYNHDAHDSPKRQDERTEWKGRHDLASIGCLIADRKCTVAFRDDTIDAIELELDLVPLELMVFPREAEVLLSHAADVTWLDYMLGLYVRNKA